MGVTFRKVHGAGNDFVLFTDDQAADVEPNEIRRLCARRTGVGADGLVLSRLISTAPAQLSVDYFNADGTPGTMCGNALRCAARIAAEDYGFRAMTLHMAGTAHEALVLDTGVWVTAEVRDIELRQLQSTYRERVLWFDAAHTGTEHHVAVVDDVDAIDAEAFGRLVRHHPQLPGGTNVNFVQRTGTQELKIRTYERGVEAETLSCGSGAVAAVVIAQHRGLVSPGETTVHNRSGQPLTIVPNTTRAGRSYWISGPVTTTFEGVLA